MNNEGCLYKIIFEEQSNIQVLVDESNGLIIYANRKACLEFNIREEDIEKKSIEETISNKSDYDITITPINCFKKDYLLYTIIKPELTIKNVLLSNIFYNSNDPVVAIDKNYCVVDINNSFRNFFGFTRREIIGNKLSAFILPKDIPVQRFDEEVLDKNVIIFDTVRKDNNNKIRNVSIIGIPHYIDDVFIGALIIYQDQGNVSVGSNLEVFKEIIEETTDGVVIADINRNIVWVNDSYEEITGYSLQEVSNKNPNVLSSGNNSKEFYRMMWEKINVKGEWQGEIWNKKKDGTLYLQWLHIFVIKDRSGEAKNYIGIFKDLSQINSVNKKMLLLLEKDPLTAVYNRNYFFEKLEQAFYRNENFYVLFADIDGFKELNNKFGHQVGDLLLVEFAKRMLNSFNGATIARYGGDEFMIFLEGNVSKELLLKKIEHFFDNIKNDVIVKSVRVKLTTSIGIALAPVDASTPEDIIRCADKAMYYAKLNKIGYCFYNEIKEN